VSSLDDLIHAPKVDPFTLWPVCYACGAGAKVGLYARWNWIYLGLNHHRVNLSFCRGAKPPTEDKQLMGLMGPAGKVEVSYECAGVFRPHFHVQCNSCHAQWLMELRSQREG
jgi:hypothetical protein